MTTPHSALPVPSPAGPDRPHICLVTETFPPDVNGVAMTLRELKAGLEASGHRVSLVRPAQARAEARRSRAGSAAPPNIDVRGVPLPGYPGLRCGLPAHRVLGRSWAADRPDAIYVATEGPLGWSAVRTAKRLKIPVLSGFHTNFDTYCRHYRLAWLRLAVSGYLRAFHNNTQGTLVPTGAVRDRLRATGFRNVSVMTRGVDRQRFSPARRSGAVRAAWGAGPEDLVVLSVGRVAAEKNLDLAVEAYRAIRSANESARFVIIGDGPVRQALQRRAPDVLFPGQQEGDTLAASYASADLFLFPSESETFGNVTLEAMASGLVVVAYDYAAAQQHVRHDESGVLVPFGDAAAFVREAVRISGDAETFEAIRRTAPSHAGRCSWGNVVADFAHALRNARPPSTATSSDVADGATSRFAH